MRIALVAGLIAAAAICVAGAAAQDVSRPDGAALF